jgi:hypothetical protein
MCRSWLTVPFCTAGVSIKNLLRFAIKHEAASEFLNGVSRVNLGLTD